jgi:chaperonin cofactor prefoldin
MNSSLQPASVRRVLTLAGALALLAGGTAFAQQNKDDQDLKGSFDQPLQNDDAQGESNSTMMLSEADGQHTYTVKIENGKVASAEVDGKKVPKDRVKNKGGKVQILDEDGNVLKSFNTTVVHGMGGNAIRLQGVPGGVFQVQPWRGQAQGGGGMPGAGAWAMGEQPRVMMGITMSDAADGETGAVVDSVMDGLPASKAGLQPGDRITSADGKKVESQQGLRDILKDKNPGDSIELKVDRDGKTKTLSIKLAKFESTKLGMPQGQGGMTDFFARNDHHEAFEEAKKSLQKALDELAANENLKPDKIKAKATEALKQAIEALDQAKEKMSSQMNELHGEVMKGLNDGDHRWLFSDGGKGGAFVIPTPAPSADANVSKQLEKLSEQLERLSKRLDQLEKDKK